MSENLKKYENEIRADERKRVGKALEALYKRALKIGELHDSLAADLGKFNDAHHPVERTNGSALQVKAKRKPVTAPSDVCYRLSGTLIDLSERYPNGRFSLKQLNTQGVGPRVLAAAMRHLVGTRQAIEQPRGKFRAVAQPAVADGAGK